MEIVYRYSLLRFIPLVHASAQIPDPLHMIFAAAATGATPIGNDVK